MTRAQDAYNETSKDIVRLMKELAAALRLHAIKQAMEPSSWAFGGDLLSVRQDLISARNFITSIMTNEEVKQIVDSGK